MDLFLQAAALIQAQIPATHFAVVGDGPAAYSQEVRAIAAALGLQNLHWMGWMPDVAPLLRRTDVLISCSDQEAFGRSIVEAMSWRVPVVATRAGGPQEIVVDGVTGALLIRGIAKAWPSRWFGCFGRHQLVARWVEKPGVA